MGLSPGANSSTSAPSCSTYGADGLSERAVASYIAKYATKGAEASGTVDHRLSCRACGGRGRLTAMASCGHCHGTGLKPGLNLDALPVTEHARRMIRTCWELGARPEYRALRLRPWAHMLGFRGHFSSKIARATPLNLTDCATPAPPTAPPKPANATACPPSVTPPPSSWATGGSPESGYTSGEAIMAEYIRQRSRPPARSRPRGRTE